jgi:hypothetical protein
LFCPTIVDGEQGEGGSFNSKNGDLMVTAGESTIVEKGSNNTKMKRVEICRESCKRILFKDGFENLR